MISWADTSVTYLGIKLTCSPFYTIVLNYSDLAVAFEKECKCLQGPYVSWMVRISLVKMNLLPKFIYICRAFPYNVPKPTINKLQSQLLSLIWANIKSKVSKSLLFLNSKDGGLGIPDLLRYVTSAILE